MSAVCFINMRTALVGSLGVIPSASRCRANVDAPFEKIFARARFHTQRPPIAGDRGHGRHACVSISGKIPGNLQATSLRLCWYLRWPEQVAAWEHYDIRNHLEIECQCTRTSRVDCNLVSLVIVDDVGLEPRQTWRSRRGTFGEICRETTLVDE